MKTNKNPMKIKGNFIQHFFPTDNLIEESMFANYSDLGIFLGKNISKVAFFKELYSKKLLIRRTVALGMNI